MRLTRWFPVAFLLLFGLLFGGSAWAATCSYATGQGTAPSDYGNYCWIDFAGYSDATARSAGGQNFSYNLPDGSVLAFTMNVTATGATPYLHASVSPSWTGAAFGNSAFTGIPASPVLYESQNNATITVTLSSIALTPPSGAVSNYAFIAADGESTNSSENLSFTTNGSAWTLLSTVPNGAYLPTLAGVGSATVTETGTQNGSAGSYVFGTFNNPTQVSATFHGSGLQGVIFGVRFASVSVAKLLNGPRVNAADQFTYSIQTSTGTVLATGTSSGAGSGPFTIANLPTVAAGYPFVISEKMAAGSVSTLFAYIPSLTCTNNSTGASTTVMPNKLDVYSFTFTTLQFGDAIACVFTNSPNPLISGTVYSDLNHDGNYDPAGVPPEAGTGVAGLFVKISPSSGGVCQAPATAAAAVDPTTGAYNLPGVASGNYCLILDNNNTLADITPSVPAGWAGTEAPTGIRKLTVGATAPPPQNFGLFQGMSFSGNVFADTGTGGGTANNGLKDGTETGIAGVTVNALVGASNVGSAVTDGSGNYTLWLPSSVAGSVVITPAPPSGDLATGGSAGTSGGTYARPSVTITASTGLFATGVNFGVVPPNTLAPDGAQSASPGSVVFYPHTFVVGSGGQVTFSSSAVAAPVIAGWVETIYRDANCNGQIDGGDALLAAAVAAIAGQTICVVLKEFVPANAGVNSQNLVTLTASFNYVNASPALSASLTRTDTTTVSAPGTVQLSKLVSNLTQGGAAGTSNNAVPGDTLQYQIVVKNPGSAAISNLVVDDFSPSFTNFVSASCPAPVSLPAGLTACVVAAQPAVGAQGALRWTFTGSLAPGAQVIVSFQVTVSP